MEPFQYHPSLADPSRGEPSLLFLESWCSSTGGLTAGFSTRSAHNTALHVGDDQHSVINSRMNITRALGWEFKAFTCAEQVHGNHVHLVTREDCGQGRLDRLSAIPHSDALITDEPDILLVMFFADCVPLYFYDPVTKSMGLAHAGWKGTVAEIASHTVGRMTEIYGAKPENIQAAIGPSIGSCCYEVDETVLAQVRPLLESLQLGNSLNEDHKIIRKLNSSSHALLDLKHLNRQLMIKAGIMPSNIEISTWCTVCHNNILFSHRHEKGKTGRMMSWLGRKSVQLEV